MQEKKVTTGIFRGNPVQGRLVSKILTSSLPLTPTLSLWERGIETCFGELLGKPGVDCGTV